MQRLHRFEFSLMRSTSRLLAEGLDLKPEAGTPDAGQPDVTPVFLMVSGGKDSMALLNGVHAFAHSTLFGDRHRVRFYVLHCDHLTRGGDSSRDAEFVTAAALGCGFPVLRAVWSERSACPSHPRDDGASFQALASGWRRRVRRGILERWGPSCLFVTAHHAGDRAESILLNLVRGASVAGLAGMTAWHRDERIIRPLLGVPDGTTKAYLEERGLTWREDASNSDTRYRRNAIRQLIMPALRQLNPDVEAAINRLGDSVAGLGPCSEPAAEAGMGHLAAAIRRDHPGYLRHLTRAQLANLAHHADLSQQDGRQRSVTLSRGWRATCRTGGVQLLPPDAQADQRPSQG